MNKSNEHHFDLSIWSQLLKYVKKYEQMPQVNFIVDKYGLSNRIASAYRFALVNRNNIYIEDSSCLKQLGAARNQLRDCKNVTRKLTKENEQLKAQVDFLMAIEIIDNVDRKVIKISQADQSIDENTAISLMSDNHLEERVEAPVVNFLNEYNPKIAERRTLNYFKRLQFLIDQLRKGDWKIKHLVLGLLGDIINGYIHEEYLESNFMSPTEAVLFAQDLIIRGVEFLVNNGNFETIKIVCIRGNHGRTSVRKKHATGYKNSYEWMMYTQLKKWFENRPGYEHVEWIIPKSEFATLQVYDKTWLFGHGDHFRYMGGVGGVMTPFMRWMGKMNEVMQVNKFAIAHWHQYINLPFGMINGSIIGYSPYAFAYGFKPEPPQQQFQLQDSKRGFTVNTPVILEDW